jgi:pyruvate-formate lyase-activating enzyme
MAAAAAAAARKGVAYTVGRGLYLALTDRTNSRTVVASRGPGFVMSRESNFSPLGGQGAAEPSATELAAVVDRAYDGLDIVGMGENDPGVTFAGLGEPLLRMETIVETIATVRERRFVASLRSSRRSRALAAHRRLLFCASASVLFLLSALTTYHMRDRRIASTIRARRHGVPFRVMTSGLFSPDVAAALAEAGMNTATVDLVAQDPSAYAAVMRRHRHSPPNPTSNGGIGGVTSSANMTLQEDGHGVVCAFIATLAERGVEVECTVVNEPGVETAAARALAFDLGAVRFRAREYFP